MPDFTVRVPGRVNLIGEHIDYHGLAVLPMALQRSIRVTFRPRTDHRITAVSGAYGHREFAWTRELDPAAAGDWENYIRAAAKIAGDRFAGPERIGIDAEVSSDLPAAAGLSSSTALLVAFTLALLRANGVAATFEELMDVLPEGEQFVGTRGGGMDHAAVLASREGCCSLIEFEPLSVRPIRIPSDWAFLVAHSLVTAEKSGAAREAYNARRTAGFHALGRLGLRSYRCAVTLGEDAAGRLQSLEERDAFLHVTSEARRVQDAARAMVQADAAAFARALNESHASLRDRLQVSCAALDRLADAALESGAAGARLTGAGFGGCAVIFCLKPQLAGVRKRLIETYYAGQRCFDPQQHLIVAEPANGVLYD